MKQGEGDRISALPTDLRAKILALLPIKDAVKTSGLSCLWKSEWASMPALNISDDDFESSSAFVRFVDILLLLRTSPVWKCSIKFSSTATDDAAVFQALDRWMVILLRNKIAVAQLILDCPSKYQTPSSLFACSFLKRLVLVGCTVKLTHNFKGFEQLTELVLHKFSASEEDLQRLILCCPLLKVLSLREPEDIIGNLTIRNTGLQEFDIVGEFRKLNLQTPELSFMYIHNAGFTLTKAMMIQQEESNFILAFGQCLHSITRVYLHNNSMTYLGINCLRDKLHGSFEKLEVLAIDISARCPLETSSASCLFQNAPNIKLLKIWFTEPLMELSSLGLKACSFEDCSFVKLKKLKIEEFHGLQEEMAFVKHILLASPSLDTLEFLNFLPENGDHKVELPEVLKTMLGFSRASTKAKIIFGK